ncbi:MAG: recombinase family protein [Actinomycetota bacterium]|nr:recombinase family protein [Actinomycetota bacterium]
MSRAGQDARLQLDALVEAGVQKRDVFADVTSGTRAGVDRPGMAKLLAYAEPGDTVVVWRVDRLGRSLIDVLNTVNLLREREVNLRSVLDAIDLPTTAGRMMLNMAMVAEFEADLIRTRTSDGIGVAWARGACADVSAPRRAVVGWQARTCRAGRPVQRRPLNRLSRHTASRGADGTCQVEPYCRCHRPGVGPRR